MQCLKCGKDVSSNPTFCDACLEEMALYPVKPGTPVRIPKREPPVKLTSLREQSPAEQLARTRRALQRMYVLSAILALLLSITGIMLIRTLDRTVQPQGPAKGQNYTTTQP